MRSPLPAGRASVTEQWVDRRGRHPHGETATWVDAALPFGRLVVVGESAGTVRATVDGRPVGALLGRQLATTGWIRNGTAGPPVELGHERGTSAFVLGRLSRNEGGRRRHVGVRIGGQAWAFSLTALVAGVTSTEFALYRGERAAGEAVVTVRREGGSPTATDGSHVLAWAEGSTGEEIVLAELLSLATPPSSLTSLATKLLEGGDGANG